MTPLDASSILGISTRQLRRLILNYKTIGLASLVHGNTGRSPSCKLSASTRHQILTLAGEGGVYHDANVCHMQQLLNEQEAFRSDVPL